MNGLPDFSHNRDGLHRESDFKRKEPLASVLETWGGVLIKVSKRESLDDISEENGDAVSGGASRKL